MTDEADRQKRTAELLLCVVVLIWAGNYPVAKWGISGLSFYLFNGIRFIVASLTVGAILVVQHSWTPVRREDRAGLVKAGVVANILYQMAFIVGLSLTTAGNSAVLFSTSPLWTIVFNARLHKEKIQRSVLIGMGMSMVGIITIILGSGSQLQFGGTELIGDVISLGGAVFWALNTVLQRPLVARYPPVQVSFVMLVVGAAGLSVLAIPAGVSASWSDIHWTYYLAAVASGALSIGLANVVWTMGVKRLGPGHTASFQNLVPVFAVLISYLTINEEVSLIHLLGSAVTITGVWYARR